MCTVLVDALDVLDLLVKKEIVGSLIGDSKIGGQNVTEEVDP
jgi:hypothetical protein